MCHWRTIKISNSNDSNWLSREWCNMESKITIFISTISHLKWCRDSYSSWTTCRCCSNITVSSFWGYTKRYWACLKSMKFDFNGSFCRILPQKTDVEVTPIGWEFFTIHSKNCKEEKLQCGFWLKVNVWILFCTNFNLTIASKCQHKKNE